jgi:hypothetical protein
MSPKAHLVYNALWFAHPALQAVVAAIMLWRKQHRTFPIFFTYVVFQILTFCITFPLRAERFYAIYFYAYWGTTAISVVLGFRVIHEVFADVFRPFHTLRDLGSVLFKWAGLVMLMVAAVVAMSVRSDADDPLVSGILSLQRSVRVVQCGLVLFLLVFSRYLGMSRKQKSFGIALGLGFLAIVELSLFTLGNKVFTDISVGFINMIAYNLSILVWMGYMAVKSPAREEASSMLRTQRWEQSLNEIQHPVTADSLIPMFETMVDRALSRSNGESAPVPEKMAVGENPSSRKGLAYPPFSRAASKT